MKLRHLLLVIGIACFLSPNGHGGEEAETKPQVGPGKAVTAADPKRGIQLSEKAVKSLDLRLAPIMGRIVHPVSRQSLVYFQAEVGVYRLRGGWFKLIEVSLVSRSATEATIKSEELESGDQVVVAGTPLLRVTELDAMGNSEDEDHDQ